MTKTNKIRSNVSYWNEFPDGSGLNVRAFINGHVHLWHLKGAKDLPEDQILEVQVIVSEIDAVINTPIGGIPSMRIKDKKTFEFTFKQYKEFIRKFWEEGPDYYDSI